MQCLQVADLSQISAWSIAPTRHLTRTPGASIRQKAVIIAPVWWAGIAPDASVYAWLGTPALPSGVYTLHLDGVWRPPRGRFQNDTCRNIGKMSSGQVTTVTLISSDSPFDAAKCALGTGGTSTERIQLSSNVHLCYKLNCWMLFVFIEIISYSVPALNG